MNAKIAQDLTLAMKSQDKFRLSVLRMLKSALQLEKINQKHDLTDEEVMAVIKKQVKMRNDSITEFKKFNQEDKIADLEQEIAVLSSYLPALMTREEIESVINEVFLELKPTSMKDMGQVMKSLNSKITNADMTLVSQMVKERLSSN